MMRNQADRKIKRGIDSAETLQDSVQSIRWLQITAGLTGLIGLAGLIALISQGVWAADAPGAPPALPAIPPPAFGSPGAPGGQASRPPGFQPGRTFTNPYANPNPPAAAGANGNNRQNFFDDDEEDDAPPRPGSPAAPSAAFPPPSANSAPNSGASSVNMESPGNGLKESRRYAPLSLNDETGLGDGAKEVVTDFNFPDADIMDIAKTLGKLTGKNFILDKDVKGRVTIISNSAITIGDAWRAFLTALDINGFALIPSGKMIRISRQRDARDKQLKTYVGDFSPDTDAVITRVFQLKYINAEEVARTFRNFMPANSRIIPYEQTNTVIVTDTGSNIAKLNKMLELLDVEGYDAGIVVIPVKFASATELAKLIDQLIPGSSTGTPGGGGNQPRFGGSSSASRFSARRTKEGGIINTIISDERTNTLIVHANTKGADQVRELVSKLDQKVPATTGGGKVHVVYLQFAEAEKIQKTLSDLSSQASSGLRPNTGNGAGTGINPVSASLFEGTIKVAADVPTNALVVTASPADFVTVQRVINRLDIPRDQVYVEVVIMEVAIDHSSDYSGSIINPSSGIGFVPNGDLAGFITSPIATTGAFFGIQAGQQISVPIAGGQNVNVSSVQGLIKAISTNTKANVLATPQIIALDNEEANFESSEGIPILTSTAVQGAGVQNSVGKQNVVLSIKIKPQINKISNFVKLAVTAKLGEIEARQLPAAVQNQAFATLDRTAQTAVVIGDSDTVVLGGLIRDKISEVVAKIPLLGDIPLLGWLFRSKSVQSEKSNLLIFMTPHIVRQYEKVRAILDKKLKDRDDFLETNAGGADPLRSVRDDMIRSLPDMKDITEKKPDSSVIIDEEKSNYLEEKRQEDSTPSNFRKGGDPKGPSQKPPTETPPASQTGADAPLSVPDQNPAGNTAGGRSEINVPAPGTPPPTSPANGG
jgi:general secretion pathway protein D